MAEGCDPGRKGSPRREEVLEDPREEEAFLMRTPPTSVAGWIGPVVLYLTVWEAMRLERTSALWRRWLESAEEVWRALATSCGISIAIEGPLSRYVEVSSWRRVCCEVSGVVSRELSALETAAAREGCYEAGTIVELADGGVGEVVRPLRSGSRAGARLEEYEVRSSSGVRTVAASAARAPPARSPRWWRAVAALEIEEPAARDFCCGIAFRFWRAEAGGVFTFAALRATPVHYRRRGCAWTWSPDRVNWMPCTEVFPDGARWRAHSLVDANRQIARFLHKHDPRPPAFCLGPTTAEVVASPRAAPPARRADDDRAARSARRALSPDAHGAVLANANTHVHVVHGPFERPTNLLHLDPWTLAGHPGGWIHSFDAASTWNLGHAGKLDDAQTQPVQQDHVVPMLVVVDDHPAVPVPDHNDLLPNAHILQPLLL